MLVPLLMSLSVSAGPHQASSIDLFNGRWELVSGEREGKRIDMRDAGEVLRFVANRVLSSKRMLPEGEATFFVNSVPRPAEFTLVISKPSGDSFVLLGIVEQRGDRLRICMNGNINGRPLPRPKSFATAAGSDLGMISLRKVK